MFLMVKHLPQRAEKYVQSFEFSADNIKYKISVKIPIQIVTMLDLLTVFSIIILNIIFTEISL